MTPPGAGGDAAKVSIRWPELAVAGFLMAIGVLVIADAMRVGTGWGEDGPRSGRHGTGIRHPVRANARVRPEGRRGGGRRGRRDGPGGCGGQDSGEWSEGRETGRAGTTVEMACL